ncbi:MAG: zf-TFIIB domain-containing protein, partial [Phycisphaerales bacterium]|nr:zf-TFIIB domain-containing protein [Phycisphaerales bacterium]
LGSPVDDDVIRLFTPVSAVSEKSMQCPSCKSAPLQPVRLDAGPPAHACAGCGGHWVASAAYLDWVATFDEPGSARPPTPPSDPDDRPQAVETAEEESAPSPSPTSGRIPTANTAARLSGESAVTRKPSSGVTVAGSRKAKLCPECGHLMIRYRVAHDIDFQVDRCNHCNGVWLDRDEWEVLRRQGLHRDLHRVFSEPWQLRLRQEEAQQALEAIYERKLGTEVYHEIRRIRAWIDGHPERSTLLAYLKDRGVEESP